MKTWVLDTNVIVVGLLSHRGPAAMVVDASYADRLRVAYDDRILEEYADVPERPKFKITRAERLALLLKLHASGLRVVPLVVSVELPDDDDRPFIEVALGLPEPTVVTRNGGHFLPAKDLGVRVLTPEEALIEFQTA